MIFALPLLLLPGKPPDEGMEAWRRPDVRGQACVSCHSPDGIELAVYRFSESDIRRRASRHLNDAGTANVLRLIEWHRKARPASLDVSKDRYLQPGGSVLPGTTATDRDLAFAKELETRVPSLFGSIDTLEQAKRAFNDLRAVSLDRLRIAIPLNRISEDPFRGADHRSLGNWFADVPLSMPAEAIAAQDRYLEAPTEANLRAIDRLVLAANPVRLPYDSINLSKYRSLLIGQHLMRGGTLSSPLGDGPDANPMWQLAEFAWVYRGRLKEYLPAGVQGLRLRDFSKTEPDLRLPWFWLGWMHDPGLQRSGFDPETKTAHYFVQALFDDGPYPVHAAFVVAKRMAVQEGPPEIQFSALRLGRLLELGQPKDPAHRTKFRRLCANTLRMMLLLVEEDVRRTGKALRKESQVGQIDYVARTLQLSNPRDMSLIQGVKKQLEAVESELR